MTVDLLDHNKESYKKIMGALASGIRKLAISHATGTGKSYLVAKLFEDYKDEKKLVLVPSTKIVSNSSMPTKNILTEKPHLVT